MLISCPNCNSTFRVPHNAIPDNGRIVRCSTCSNEWLAKPENEITNQPTSSSNSTAKENDILKDKSESNGLENVELNNEVKTQKDSTKEGVIHTEVKAEINSTITDLTKDSLESQADKIKEENIKSEMDATIAEKAIDPSDPITPKVYVRYQAPKIPLYDSFSLRYFIYFTMIFTMLGLLTFNFIRFHSTLIANFPRLSMIYEKIGIYDHHDLRIMKVECQKRQIESSNNTGNLVEVQADVTIHNSGLKLKKLSKMRFTVYNSKQEMIDELILDVNKEVEPNQTIVISGRLNRLSPECIYVAVDTGNLSDFILRNIDYIKIG